LFCSVLGERHAGRVARCGAARRGPWYDAFLFSVDDEIDERGGQGEPNGTDISERSD
jgi:hypothetical protein